MKYLSIVLLVVMVGGMLMTPVSFAQTMSTQDQLNLIQQLMAQVQALQAQLSAIQGGGNVASPVSIPAQSVAVLPIVSTLSQGSRGDEVSVMQALLALDTSAYPSGLVTGYFGVLSDIALRMFQKNQKLTQNGITDIKTRDALNVLLQKYPLAFEHVGGVKKLCAAISQGVAMPTGWTRVQQGTSSAVVSRCSVMPQGVSAPLSAPITSIVPTTIINPGATDKNAPVISNVAITSVTANAMTVKWATDKEVQSVIDWWKKPEYVSVAVDTWSNETWTKTHLKTLSGLEPDTIYYVRITARDKFGNMTVYPEQIAKTNPLADKTAPGILSVRVDRWESTATVMWTTNEPTKGKVYYGTMTPLKTTATTTQSVSTTALATSTTVTVSGLEVGKIYYYIIEASDAANNKTLTPEQPFFTAQYGL